MTENGACWHVFAVAHGAFASGVEVVEVFPVQHDVKPDVAYGEPAAFCENVLVVRVVVIHHYEFGVPILVEVESVFVVAATATPVKEPGVSASSGNTRIAYACIGVGELFVCHEAFGFHGGNQLFQCFRAAYSRGVYLIFRFAQGATVQSVRNAVVADHGEFVLAEHVVGVRFGSGFGDHVETAVVERVPLAGNVRES